MKFGIPPSPPDTYIKALIIQGFFVACFFSRALSDAGPLCVWMTGHFSPAAVGSSACGTCFSPRFLCSPVLVFSRFDA